MTRGFTLIELMVVIFLIGLIATIGIPRFLQSSAPLTKQFIHKLNTLVVQAAEQAQQAGEARRVFFDLSARTVEVQTVQGHTLGRKLPIPDQIGVADVIINNVSQFQVGGVKRTFYFLINAEGVSQQVRLVLTEPTETGERTYELLLNPFTTLFRLV